MGLIKTGSLTQFAGHKFKIKLGYNKKWGTDIWAKQIKGRTRLVLPDNTDRVVLDTKKVMLSSKQKTKLADFFISLWAMRQRAKTKKKGPNCLSTQEITNFLKNEKKQNRRKVIHHLANCFYCRQILVKTAEKDGYIRHKNKSPKLPA